MTVFLPATRAHEAPTTRRHQVDRLGVEGSALALAKRWDEALERFEAAVALDPYMPQLRECLGTVLMALGRSPEAIEQFRTCLKRNPHSRPSWDNLVFLTDHAPETTPESALAVRRAWWRSVGLPIAARRYRSHANTPDPERPLRVGYVSGDVHHHSAPVVWGPMVHGHDPRGPVVPILYSSTPQSSHDEMTAFYRDHLSGHDGWRDVAGVSDEALAEQIVADRIDILIDLSGYSGLNRLRTFCLTPAPVQATGWGYATGTGLPVIDAFFADAFVVPQEHRKFFTERVIDLPCVVPYDASPWAPDPNPLPSLYPARPFTFGSFSRAQKLSETTFDLWASVLRAVPDSILLCKEWAFDSVTIIARVVNALGARGIDPERYECRGGSDQRAHLAAYHDVDLALDPFPHGGGVTTLDGLWMGVPVVTLLGDRVVSRLSGSFLQHMHLAQFIATTAEEYVHIATTWASPDRRRYLAVIRDTLRGVMQGSELRGLSYVRVVEEAYRELWRGWCEGRRKASPS